MDIFEASRTNQLTDLAYALIDNTPDVTDQRGSTPLIIATYYNHVEAASILLSAGADPDRKDSMGNTPLMGACFKGHADVARLLLNNGAVVDAVNGNMASALIFAATFGRLEIIELLLAYGANPLIRDRNGKTPVDHAKVQENDQCYEVLAAAANERIRQLISLN